MTAATSMLAAVIVAIIVTGAAPAAALCGDGALDGGEQCDDGNLVAGDGCSAGCEVEAALSAEQRRCLSWVLRSGVDVVKKQANLVNRCVRSTAINREAFPQVCVELDEIGSVARGRARTMQAAQDYCTVLPAYGVAAPDVVNDAAVDGVIGFAADLFGTNLDISVVDDPGGARLIQCQGSVTEAAQNLLRKELVLLRRCLKVRTASRNRQPILSPADAAGCVDALDADARGQLADAQDTVARLVEKDCSELDGSWPFPGSCPEAAGFVPCVRDRIDCRACRAFNAMANVEADCDGFDDGVGNLSCP